VKSLKRACLGSYFLPSPLQTALLSCETVAALCTIPFAESMEKAVATGTEQYASNSMAQVLGLLCGGPLPLLLIIDLHREDIWGWLKCPLAGVPPSGRLRCLAAVLLCPAVGLVYLIRGLAGLARRVQARCEGMILGFYQSRHGAALKCFYAGLVLVGIITIALASVVISE
jgi:hypothetical protein